MQGLGQIMQKLDMLDEKINAIGSMVQEMYENGGKPSPSQDNEQQEPMGEPGGDTGPSEEELRQQAIERLKQRAGGQ